MLKGKKTRKIQKKQTNCKVLNRLDGVEHYCSVQSCTDVKLALLHTLPCRGRSMKRGNGSGEGMTDARAKPCDSVL